MSCKSGYTFCLCRDCMEIAGSDIDGNPKLCLLCEEAGCSAECDRECLVDLEPDDFLILMSDDEPESNN